MKELSREEVIASIKSIRKILTAKRENFIMEGSTKVSLNGNSIIIDHNRTGTNPKDLDENLKILKIPLVKELKRLFKVESETGSLDHYYKLKVRIRPSEKVTIIPNRSKLMRG